MKMANNMDLELFNMQKEIFLKESFSMDNVYMHKSHIMMAIIMKVKCTKINFMDQEILKIIKEFKKDYSDMEILYLVLLILMMERFFKDLYKMAKSQVMEFCKEMMDFIIQAILDMINSMAAEKFIILINQFIKVSLKMDFNMEKDI
jgi:hypothetical protein